MAASKQTVSDIVDILLKYVDEVKLQKMLKDLAAVEGNRSFTETVKRLHHEAVRRRLFPKEKP